MLLGAYGLTTNSSSATKHINVSEIHVHPDWKEFSEARYDADIAIILLNDSVIFTNFIQPVCMPRDDDVTDAARGFIVGWDVEEQTPKQSVITTFNNLFCYTTNSQVILPLSTRMFCGIGEAGTPIRYVSGGGFFVLSGSAWVQYGIAVKLTSVTGRSEENSFIVLTNVNSFKSWITYTVKQSGDAVGEAIKMKINVTCEYVHIYNYQ